MDPIDALLDAMEGKESRQEPRTPATPAELKALYERYITPNTFAPGDVVRFKKGLSNVNYPKEGECGVVLQVDPSRRARTNKMEAYVDAPEGVRVGCIVNDGAFQAFWLDENRLEHAPDTGE